MLNWIIQCFPKIEKLYYRMVGPYRIKSLTKDIEYLQKCRGEIDNEEFNQLIGQARRLRAEYIFMCK